MPFGSLRNTRRAVEGSKLRPQCISRPLLTDSVVSLKRCRYRTHCCDTQAGVTDLLTERREAGVVTGMLALVPPYYEYSKVRRRVHVRWAALRFLLVVCVSILRAEEKLT